MLVGDDRDQPPGDRVLDLLADQLLVALVNRMHRDRHVGEHRLGARRGDLDCAAIVGERVTERVELALDVPGLDLEIADRGLELRVPVHQALVAIDEPALVQLDERVRDRALIALVHGEALVRPVAAGAEAAELASDRAARLRFPFPDVLEESLATNFGALDALALEVALDHHLRRNAGMVGADHPERVLAEHPLAASEHVLKRDVERMADVQRAGDVGRRHDDRPWSLIAALGPEQALGLPVRVPAILDRAGLECLGKLAHASGATSDAALQHQLGGYRGRPVIREISRFTCSSTICGR